MLLIVFDVVFDVPPEKVQSICGEQRDPYTKKGTSLHLQGTLVSHCFCTLVDLVVYISVPMFSYVSSFLNDAYDTHTLILYIHVPYMIHICISICVYIYVHIYIYVRYVYMIGMSSCIPLTGVSQQCISQVNSFKVEGNAKLTSGDLMAAVEPWIFL